MQEHEREHPLLMLGEIRGDIKYLVQTVRATSERLDKIEESHGDRHGRLEARVRTLENFKITLGVFTTALAIAAPMLMTAVLKKLGII